MKISKLLLVSALAVVGLTGCGADKTAVVKVNGDDVTKAQFEEAYNKESKSPQYQQFASFLKDENSIMSLMLKDRIVNELILKTIIKQEIAKRNITASKEEIEAKKEEIADKLGSKDKIEELLKKNGISEQDFEEDIKKGIELDKLVASAGDTKVTEKEIKDFYNKNKAQFNYPERVRASHILIEVNPAQIKQEIISQDDKGKLTSEEINEKTQKIIDEKMELAKEVRAKAAANPSNFAQLAKQYSDDKVSAAKGGDLGFFTKDQMVKPFSDAAFKLKPHTVSEVVVTDFGNHIIVVTDKAQAGVQPYDKIKDEITVYLEQKKKVEVLTSLLEGLKASAKIEYVNPDYDTKTIQDKIKEKAKEEEKLQKNEEAAKAVK